MGREIIIHVNFSAISCKINSKPMFCFVFSTLSALSPVSIETACLKRFQSIWNDAMVLLVISNYLLVDEGHLSAKSAISQAAKQLALSRSGVGALCSSSFTDELAGSIDHPGIWLLFVV